MTTPKPIPASVLREIATWPLEIADPEYTAILGNGPVCAMDIAAYALALQEAARELTAHLDEMVRGIGVHKVTFNVRKVEPLRALLPPEPVTARCGGCGAQYIEGGPPQYHAPTCRYAP